MSHSERPDRSPLAGGVDDAWSLGEMPERRPDPALVERVQALGHGKLQQRRPRSVPARAADMLLSVAVASLAFCYLAWAVAFTTGLYH